MAGLRVHAGLLSTTWDTMMRIPPSAAVTPALLLLSVVVLALLLVGAFALHALSHH